MKMDMRAITGEKSSIDFSGKSRETGDWANRAKVTSAAMEGCIESGA